MAFQIQLISSVRTVVATFVRCPAHRGVYLCIFVFVRGPACRDVRISLFTRSPHTDKHTHTHTQHTQTHTHTHTAWICRHTLAH